MTSAGTRAKVYLNGADISSYLRSASSSGSRDMLDATTLGMDDRAFIGGLKNLTFTGEGLYDAGEDAIDTILSEVMDADEAILTYLPAGDALGNRGIGLEGDESGYDIASPVDGLTTINVNVQSSIGADPVQVLHPLSAVSATANGTGVDQLAASSNGGSAFLQVTAMDRTTGDETMVVKVQDSDDNAVFVDLITFTSPTEPGAQFGTVTGTVERYVRAQHTLAGNTPSGTYSLTFSRN